MQAERRLLARREHDPQLRRQPREQQLQPGERVFGVELVQVVDHQHERLLEPLELRQEPLDHHRAREARRRADPLDHLVAGGVGERVDQMKPEPLRVTFAALDRDPGDGLVEFPRPMSAAERSSRFPRVRRRASRCPERRLTAARRERVAKRTDRPGIASAGGSRANPEVETLPQSHEVCDDRSHASAGALRRPSNHSRKVGPMTPDYLSPDNVLVVTFGEDPENDKNAYQALTDLKQLDSQDQIKIAGRRRRHARPRRPRRRQERGRRATPTSAPRAAASSACSSGSSAARSAC